MKPIGLVYLSAFSLGIIALLATAPVQLNAQQNVVGQVNIDNDDLGGVVRSTNGPEAGVWVIVETKDLPTKFAKVVVTDDQGRYVMPDLPKASYSVWVRGYGLIDSPKVQATPGKILNLTAVLAPNAAAAAEYYPGMYWYSMLKIPDKSEFPGTGTGDNGNGMSPVMYTQHAWIDLTKNSCQSCHGLGTKGMRTIPKEFTKSGNSMQAWAQRVTSGGSLTNMAQTLGWFGSQKALANFADWTDRIAAGELPFDKPSRPQGIERNVVITMWDWSTNKAYMHDEVATDKNNPSVNANGLIYGSPEESTDMIPVLDPVRHTATEIRHPHRDPNTPTSANNARGHSVYWGDSANHDSHSSVHNLIMDDQGRMWFTARIRHANTQPDFCKQGSNHPSAKVVPLNTSSRQISMYEPKTQKWTLIDVCFNTHHLYFANDANRTIWISQGSPNTAVVGWLNTKMFLETGDAAKSQGWTPIIVDTNGNGKRDAFVAANQPVDPTKDKRMTAAFYGIMPSTVDDSVWGQSMEGGFGGLAQPGYIVRIVPGANPSETSLSEVYVPPEGAYGPRGIDLDLNGVVWTALSSGHMASFDRRKCKGPLNGPNAASGKLCPEGWTLYQMPGPQFKGVTDPGSADHAYYIQVDRYNTLGLGANVPVASTNGGESLLAVVNGKLVNLRVPYPMGFFTKNVDGRIDDAKAGWKGRGMWTTLGTRAQFHNEGGTDNKPKVYKLQMRPDPLAK